MTDKELIQLRKKEFREYALPIFPIELTHGLAINGQTYRVVGQQTMKSIIFTNYQVIDELGHDAPPDIRGTIFSYITKFQLIEQFLSYIELMEQQEAESLLAQYDSHIINNIEYIILQNEQLIQNLIKMREEVKQLTESSTTWEIENLQNFDELWEQIKQIYEQRIPAIMRYRDFILDEALVDDSLPSGLHSLYEEAKLLYQLFYETISTNPEQLKDLNEFIELNCMLGHVEETVPEQNTFNQWEKFLNIFFKRFTYLIVIFGFVGLTIINGFDIMTTLYALFFLSLSFSLHVISNSSMLNKAHTQTSKQRELRMSEQQQTREQYRQTYEDVKSTEQPIEQKVELETVTARNSIIVTTIGSIIFLYAVIMDNHEETIEQTVALVGFVIVIIGLLLPKQTPSKRNIILKGNEISRGNQSISLDNLTKIESKRKGKKYEVYARNAQYPLKFRIPKTTIQQTKAELKSWCERHLIEFEE